MWEKAVRNDSTGTGCMELSFIELGQRQKEHICIR